MQTSVLHEKWRLQEGRWFLLIQCLHPTSTRIWVHSTSFPGCVGYWLQCEMGKPLTASGTKTRLVDTAVLGCLVRFPFSALLCTLISFGMKGLCCLQSSTGTEVHATNSIYILHSSFWNIFKLVEILPQQHKELLSFTSSRIPNTSFPLSISLSTSFWIRKSKLFNTST